MNEKAKDITSKVSEMELPCKVSLTRPGNLIGAAMGVRVFLNSVEQEVLKNGKTIIMHTGSVQNELTVRYNADDMVRSIQFEATSGGSVQIKLKYSGGVLTIED